MLLPRSVSHKIQKGYAVANYQWAGPASLRKITAQGSGNPLAQKTKGPRGVQSETHRQRRQVIPDSRAERLKELIAAITAPRGVTEHPGQRHVTVVPRE